MHSEQLQTPVLFIIFNKPIETKAAFASIRRAKPTRLYIAGDGPRKGVPNDTEMCAAARNVALKVDWPCEVVTWFNDENQGCGKAVSDTLYKFFRQEKEGIVLEEDCVAHPDFFPYCAELLDRYRDEPKVSVIGGSNFQFGKKYGDASYYFSSFSHSWGWASWSRTIDLFDMKMAGLEEFLAQDIMDWVTTDYAREYFSKLFRQTAAGKIDTWDFQFRYSIWKNKGGYGILPNSNLVHNIGFNQNATHTKKETLFSLRGLKPLGPITHPKAIERTTEADNFYMDSIRAMQGDGLDIFTFFATEIVQRLAQGDIHAAKELLDSLNSFYANTRLEPYFTKIYQAAQAKACE